MLAYRQAILLYFNISSLSGKVTLLPGADISGQLNGHKIISVELFTKYNTTLISYCEEKP